MTAALITVAIVGLLLVAAELKSGRPDGTLLSVHPYRRLMFFIMPTRNESVVYFDASVDAEALLAYVDEVKDRMGAGLTHCIVGACAKGLAEVPHMNRFTVGKRLYQRTGRWITFSMKRKKLDRKARLAVVKLRMEDDETFEALVRRINGQIDVNRSGKKTSTDKEFDLLSALPRPALALFVAFATWLDNHNLLPAWFIEGDAMFSSCVVTNLGSLHMGPGFHHLYEWGNCPLFVMVGQVEERAVVRDGQVVARKVLPIRFSYDERIDDGLNARFGIDAVKRVLENPHEELGCVADDGTDRVVLGAADAS